MTTPTLGDMPDWQILSAPNMVAGSQVNIASGQDVLIFSGSQPARIWSAWLSISMGSNASYVAAVNRWGAQIQDSNGVVYLRLEGTICVAGQTVNLSLGIPLLGVQNPVVAGASKLHLVTDAALTNVTTRANGGAIASSP